MNTVFGLPSHPLLAHVVVAIVPLAALLVVLTALLPRLSWSARWAALTLSALSVPLMPLMESSGEALEDRVPETALVERHEELGEELLPWVIGLFLVCLALLVANRWMQGRVQVDGPGTPPASLAASRRLPLAVRIILGSLAVVVAAGTMVQTVRVGHSGAEATWSTPGPNTPLSPGEDNDR